jgi:hypothetical protein
LILHPEMRLSYFYSKSFKHLYIPVSDIHIYHYSVIHTSTYTPICKHKHIYTPKIITHQVLIHINYSIQDALYVYQVQHTQDHISLTNIYSIKSLINKRYHELAGGGRGIGPPLDDYFLYVQTSLELWPSSDVGATTIAFLRASSSAFF